MTEPTPRPSAQQIIERFGLEPLPVEGGMYRQWYRSTTMLAPEVHERGPESKPVGTAIFALVTDDPDSFSAMHRLCTDELWHYYLGDPIELVTLTDDGSARTVVLGPDVLNGHEVAVCVPANTWMGARLAPHGQWCLFGNTMAPGWTTTDFELADTETLVARHPEHEDVVRALSRPDQPRTMPTES